MCAAPPAAPHVRQVLADVAAGRVKLLFVSPERLSNPHLLEALRPRMPLPLVVVDEAHCVAGEARGGAGAAGRQLGLWLDWEPSGHPPCPAAGPALASAQQVRRCRQSSRCSCAAGL